MCTTTPTRLLYLLFSVLFITACSSLSVATADKSPSSASIAMDRQNAIQQWIKARAAYERTLDYSSLEQEKKYKYRAMRNLVEARYFLMLAEKDLQYNSDKSVVLDDFDQARQLLEKALATANTADRQKIEAIHKQLDKMRLAVKRDIAAEFRWLPVDQRSAFDAILAQLEDLIRGQ